MKQKKKQSINANDELDYIPLDVDDYIDTEEIKKEYAKSNIILTDEQTEKLKILFGKIMEFGFIRFQQHQQEKQKCKILELNTDEEKSHHIHTSKHRRAS